MIEVLNELLEDLDGFLILEVSRFINIFCEIRELSEVTVEHHIPYTIPTLWFYQKMNKPVRASVIKPGLIMASNETITLRRTQFRYEKERCFG